MVIKAFRAATAAVLVAGAIATTAPVYADDAAVLKQLQDRTEIEALMWRYVRALDTFDADAYVTAFTEDGSFGETKGRAALHKMVADLKARRTEASAPMHHVIANHTIEFLGPDEARYDSYWMTVFAPAGETPLRVAAVGRGVDTVVRVDGKWLIKSRNVAPE